MGPEEDVSEDGKTSCKCWESDPGRMAHGAAMVAQEVCDLIQYRCQSHCPEGLDYVASLTVLGVAMIAANLRICRDLNPEELLALASDPERFRSVVTQAALDSLPSLMEAARARVVEGEREHVRQQTGDNGVRH